ncbi:alpha- and gamma-adaptin-binding protein p34 [Erpetoichthys calabaricus]|uniref:Alpha and gamma adaptin binding protein n=1 Tax=Erpetoichthys calabaricus TaxID=27687 RepID=A0A8C4TED6_ERPCA|nr:alpha- and gamma-adaptin-binding protein p34 [Erpetoichthys calabaricus]
MSGVPCVLLTSCDLNFPAEELAEQIIGGDGPAEALSPDTDVCRYPWTIDNKYYRADVHLCVLPERSALTAETAEAAQAFAVYFNSHVKCGLECVTSWLPVIEPLCLDVLILVCDRVSETGVSRQKAQEWCIAHGFELVELEPEVLPDEDDDFPESTGVKRIVQALNANVWSNMEMKDEGHCSLSLMGSLVASHHSFGPSNIQQADFSVAGDQPNELPSSNGTPPDSTTDAILNVDIQELANLTTGEADLDNFERLFTKLKEMKDKAATLPHAERKLHAEKVAKAFWMAIGGEQDEVEGLSSDDDG